LQLGTNTLIQTRLAAAQLDLDLLAEGASQLPGVTGQHLKMRPQRLQLQAQETFQLVLGVAQETALIGFEIGGHLPETRCQHGERLARHGLGLREAVLRHLSQLLQTGAGGQAGEREQPHGGGRAGEAIGRRCGDPMLDHLRPIAGEGTVAGPLLVGFLFRGGRGRADQRVCRDQQIFQQLTQSIEKLGEPGRRRFVRFLQEALAAVAQFGDGAQVQHAAGTFKRVELAARLGGGGLCAHLRRQLP